MPINILRFDLHGSKRPAVGDSDTTQRRRLARTCAGGSGAAAGPSRCSGSAAPSDSRSRRLRRRRPPFLRRRFAARDAAAGAKLEPPKFEALSPNPPRVDLSRGGYAVASPQSDQTVGTAPRGDDAPAYMPLGEWESDGAKSADKRPVRIERCGPALSGYALTETSTRGENVLVNMKQTAHDVWTGNVFSRSSGDTHLWDDDAEELRQALCRSLRDRPLVVSGNDGYGRGGAGEAHHDLAVASAAPRCPICNRPRTEPAFALHATDG